MFSFSEKATKIWSYHPLDLTFTKSKCQIKWVTTLNFCCLLTKTELYHCNEIFSSERNVELHIDFAHELKNRNGEKPYKCLKCDFSFLKKEELSKNFQCMK